MKFTRLFTNGWAVLVAAGCVSVDDLPISRSPDDPGASSQQEAGGASSPPPDDGGAGDAIVTLPTHAADPSSCEMVEAGRVVEYRTVGELEALIVGDWLYCLGIGFPSARGESIRISADHSWSALKWNDDGDLQPVDTVEGYGTWTALEISPGEIQFSLLIAGGGRVDYALTLTDTGRLLLATGDLPTEYVSISLAGEPSEGDSGAPELDSGTSPGSDASDRNPGTTLPTHAANASSCSVARGRVIAYSTTSELEELIVGDWLHCSGTLLPSTYGEGLRITRDHRWFSLKANSAGELRPIATQGYGTWTAVASTADSVQLQVTNMDHIVVDLQPAFTETGWLLLPFGGPTAYIRVSLD